MTTPGFSQQTFVLLCEIAELTADEMSDDSIEHVCDVINEAVQRLDLVAQAFRGERVLFRVRPLSTEHAC